MEQGVFMSASDFLQLKFDIEQSVKQAVLSAKKDAVEPHVTAKEAAAHLGFSERTFRRMVKDDPKMPRHRIRNRDRFKKSELDKYFNK